MDAKLARKAIPGARGDNAQRHLIEDERGCDLVDRAVSAPRHHKTGAPPDRRLRQLASVTHAFGHEDFHRIAVRVDHRERDLRPRTSDIRTRASRNRIDDDCGEHYRRASLRMLLSPRSISSTTSAEIFVTR